MPPKVSNIKRILGSSNNFVAPESQVCDEHSIRSVDFSKLPLASVPVVSLLLKIRNVFTIDQQFNRSSAPTLTDNEATLVKSLDHVVLAASKQIKHQIDQLLG